MERSESYTRTGSKRRPIYLRSHKLTLPRAEHSLQSMPALKTGTSLWSMILLERTPGFYWGRFNYKKLTVKRVDVLTKLIRVVPTLFLESWTTFMYSYLFIYFQEVWGHYLCEKECSVPRPNQKRAKQQRIVEGVIWSQAIQLRHVHPGRMTHQSKGDTSKAISSWLLAWILLTGG